MAGARNRELPEATAATMGRRGRTRSCREEQEEGAALLQSHCKKETPPLHATNTPPWPSRAPSQARQPSLTRSEAPRVLTSTQRPLFHRSRADGESTATASAIERVRAWSRFECRGGQLGEQGSGTC